MLKISLLRHFREGWADYFRSRLFPLRWFISLTAVPYRWFYIAHGCSVLRTGLRGRALTGGPQWPAALRAVAGAIRKHFAILHRLTEAQPRQGRTAAARERAPAQARGEAEE